MPDTESLLQALGLIVVLSPLLMTLVLGVSSLLDRRLTEEATTRLVYAATVAGFLASVALLAGMLLTDSRHVAIAMGEWVVIPPDLFHFSVRFVYDRLSMPFAILSFVLSGTIAAFASKYMHREPGFNRFFVLYAIFVLGMVVTSVAGTIETLFTGWELVGLSSALLVAFFQERPAPARNGFWVWTVYRVSDAALLLAAVALHHLRDGGNFERILSRPWPYGEGSATATQALVVGLLLLAAAAGKSALIPFSGWLPRAMEGPTPSSAVFYGALSVHLGAFLLLRMAPLIERSAVLCAIIIVLGLATAGFAYLAGGVQTDIKSALSFASLAQVGIIVAEIGAGFRYVPLVHIIGHACLRTLQFVRAPSLLQDYRRLEDAIGRRLPRSGAALERLTPPRRHAWLYRFAQERGYLDAALIEFVVAPFVRAFRRCDNLERRWTDLLSGGPSRESDRVRPHATIEEFS